MLNPCRTKENMLKLDRVKENMLNLYMVKEESGLLEGFEISEWRR